MTLNPPPSRTELLERERSTGKWTGKTSAVFVKWFGQFFEAFRDRTPRVVDALALTDQTVAIGATALPNVLDAGLYRISYVLETTALDAAAGTIALQFAWTDDIGVQVGISAPLPLTALGRTSGVILAQLASGPIFYSTVLVGAIGASTHAVYVSVERL